MTPTITIATTSGTLPNGVYKKDEARELARQIFPDHKEYMAHIRARRPTETYPFYWVENHTREDLVRILEWLTNRQVKLYKAARWWLFYDLAARLVALLSENQNAKERHFRIHGFDRHQHSFEGGDGI